MYKQRAAQFAELERKALSKSQQVSWLRLAVFIVGAVLAYYFFRNDENIAGAITIILFYVLFAATMRWHSRLDFNYKQLLLLRQVNEEEIDRLEGRLQKFDGGNGFIDDQHPYTSDLDIFGQNSLFQLINRSVSSIGRLRLAEWFKRAASVEVVLARQQAVADLSGASQLNWLQEFIALPRHFKHEGASTNEFINWLRNSSFYKQNSWVFFFMFLLPALTLAAMVAWASYGFSGWIAVAFLLAQSFIGYKFRVAREEYYENSSGMYESIRSYTKQLRHIEQHTFNTPLLQQLQSKLKTDDYKASVSIHQLENIIDLFSWRLSTLMSFILNTIFMWDFIWMYRLEKWRDSNVSGLENTLDALADYEALTSIAAFQNAHPAYAIPVLSSSPFEVKAEQLAHPLIFSVKRIANDFEMQGAGKTVVVTGSNMSGKTTFLRTVGINMVLAFTGAPVCADKMRVAPAQIYTAMRTVDNLAENTSSFYAELKRLRILLELTEQKSQPVFYLLDEILKGTNSRDRHQGAMALIRQLHQRNASGLISTHDLELGAMEEELPGSVVNYSFNSMIEGNKITFDYTLRRGICHSFNASKLMQLMGIAIEETSKDNL